MTTQSTFSEPNPMDYVNATTIFGSTRRTIISKEFKGGSITNIFAETGIDFTNADISGVVVLTITQVCAETKIAVPADWRIVLELSQLFAEMKDKRRNAPQNSDKVLVIRGFSSMAVLAVYDYLID